MNKIVVTQLNHLVTDVPSVDYIGTFDSLELSHQHVHKLLYDNSKVKSVDSSDDWVWVVMMEDFDYESVHTITFHPEK